jgi:hypothetical protein
MLQEHRVGGVSVKWRDARYAACGRCASIDGRFRCGASGRGGRCAGERRRLPDGRPDTVGAPMIPLLDTTLLTNAPGELRVGSRIAWIRVGGDRKLPDHHNIRAGGTSSLVCTQPMHCS